MQSNPRPRKQRGSLDLQLESQPSSSWGSNGLVSLTVQTPTSSRFQPVNPTRSKARWRSNEFLFYIAVFIAGVPLMAYAPIALSQSSHPNYFLYEHRLSPGWILGRKVDNSDHQYRSFRSNIPALFLLSSAHLLLGNLYSRLFLHGQKGSLPNGRPTRLPFITTFALLMLVGLHGTSALKILVIMSINYLIAKHAPKSILGPMLTWAFNVAILFSNEVHDGYRFGSLHAGLEILDRIQGFYPRWHVNWNITMLRLISFNMDFFWARGRIDADNSDAVLNDKERVTTSHQEATYSFVNYIAYALYSPLYIAGPIITFNDFMWQVRRPTSIPTRSTLAYLIRFLACLLTMEIILHFMYVVAIKDTSSWHGSTPHELCMIGFWNLIIVWLKLLIPWRFFRLWALADGIDPPENMVRCMANNYSTLGFWRSWHRSYNLWIVRYIYVPIGGRSNVVLSTVIVFTFVALWHDLSFKLLAWGWLVTLFILPELVARRVFTEKKYGDRPWFRHLCAFGGMLNIHMMMAANLVGFVIGLDGLNYIVGQLVGTVKGITYIAVASTALFCGTQVMFEYREEEMRKGIYRRY